MDGYTKEILTITITENKDKLYRVNGNTCTVEMQYFNGTLSSDDCNGNISWGSSNVIKKFNDGHVESKARYIISGTDSNNEPCNIFIEDNLVGYDHHHRLITKPIFVSVNEKLSWLQTADIQGIVEDKGNGNKIIHVMWNENNTSILSYPTVKIPDQSKIYNKEIFTFDITVYGEEGFQRVQGADDVVAMMIGFTCSSNTTNFKENGLDYFVDTRLIFDDPNLWETETTQKNELEVGNDEQHPLEIELEQELNPKLDPKLESEEESEESEDQEVEVEVEVEQELNSKEESE
ncbi:hypothetical protein PIROE2DRAFT_63447 [Piromyces sp. E2]|nr:hypothetical protein PIROE2DRAFT_63447 [Piromyces sp. E2]|eukprot:OUM59950.1 hypothetical protein PIROE2DRAFT_63447 [Piromyces sp. E2]